MVTIPVEQFSSNSLIILDEIVKKDEGILITKMGKPYVTIKFICNPLYDKENPYKIINGGVK